MTGTTTTTYVGTPGGPDASHDYVLFQRRPLSDLSELMLKPAIWFHRAAPGQAIPALTTLVFQHDETVDKQEFIAEGIPANGFLHVRYNERGDWNKAMLGQEMDILKYLPEGKALAVTLRVDSTRSFVHLELKNADDAQRLFFLLLSDPQAFPKALCKRPLFVQIVPKGGVKPGEPHLVEPGLLTFKVAAGRPLNLVYQRGTGLDVHLLCIFGSGERGAGELPVGQDGKLTGPVEVQLDCYMQPLWHG